MPISVNTIRASYPNPSKMEDGNTENEYCVGGALCLYLRDNNPRAVERLLSNEDYLNFPSIDMLQDVIIAITGVDSKTARRYAANITLFNDEGDYDAAWHWIDAILASQK